MRKVRVLVVEDSSTVRHYLCELLAAHPEIDLVGSAENGKRAIELCESLRPDVISMDMMLPIVSGLRATEYIMAHFPTPILVVSSSFNRGELFQTYEALAAGAVDALEKPRGDESDEKWEREFVSMLKLVSRIRVITHLRGRMDARARPSLEEPAAPANGHAASPKLVVLGASTGGPSALVEILRNIPAPFPLPILIVLHLNEPFGKAFAEWLDGQTDHHVGFAADGDAVSALGGRVVLAPPDFHLVVQDGRLRLNGDAERHFCRPSVDVLLESVAREYGGASLGCLLTGMGRDGAAGLLMLRRAGATTIAQDESTCVVYGMPREAVLLGAAQRVLPLGEIGAALVTFAQPKSRGVP
jgi:two-component system, chemotaxis family, protein-glutamate methylesterase/glutaminase